MDSLQFCYWLQGFFELSTDNEIDEDQIKIIKDHLQLVFNKITPDYIKINPCDSISSTTVNKFPYGIPLCAQNEKLYCSTEVPANCGYPLSNLFKCYPGASC